MTKTAPLRLLVISQYFWPESFIINDLVQGLGDRGFAITVLTSIPNYPEGRFFPGYGLWAKRQEDFHTARVIRVPQIPRGQGTPLRLAANFLSFALFASLLGPLLCREPYDLILVFEPSPITVGLPALVMKKLTKAPIAFWVQDLWPESLSATGAVRSLWILKQVSRLVRLIYHHCDLILAQSTPFCKSIEEFGVATARLRYLPNYAEDLYRPMQLPPDAPERALLPPGFKVMFAGNLGQAQDFPTILAAAASLRDHPDIHWLILGDGRQRDWLEAEIVARGLQATVHLLGRHPKESMPRFFSLADALLVTLKKDPIFAMTVPSKVQSYLACAKPILAALDGEGSRIITEAAAGLAVPSEDPEALAKAVLALHALDNGARQAMGDNGRTCFEQNFDRTMLLDRLTAWLGALTTAAPDTAPP